jgi:transcriptional regulator with XRE-family HTH domain
MDSRSTAGTIVRTARVAQRMTLAELGRRTGYSAAQVSRLERGIASLSDVVVLRLFAEALAIPPGRFGLACTSPNHQPVVTVSNHREEEADPMRRRTLLAAAGLSIPLSVVQRVEDALAVPPEPSRVEGLAGIQSRLAQAKRQYDLSELAILTAGLPDLLSAAQHTAERADTPAGWALVAESHALATDVLSKIGRDGSARITADRAMQHAKRSGDPVAIGTAARPLGMVLRKDGRHEVAAAVVLRAADGLEKAGLRTAAQASTYMRLLCASAYTASWAGDQRRALERIGEAERAAGRLAALTGRRGGLPFVALYRSNINYALGDAEAALHEARGLRADMYPTPERRARLHTDRARAYWRCGKAEQAAHALLAAHREAPGEVRDRPSIRGVVEELALRHTRMSGVRELTAAMSI